tara:strand:- start:250 stop:1107 length:858 start_codon:yes stop_codon:yes gene_type:complete
MDKNESDYSMNTVPIRKPMVLAYDIECTGLLGYSYGIWDTHVHRVIEQPILLSFSYAWVDVTRIADPEYTPSIKCRTIAKTDTYSVNPKDDRLLVGELYELFSGADVTLGHNSKQFDDKMSNMFFIKHKMKPVVPHLQLDTKIIAKQVMRLPSYSLNYLSEFLGHGEKETSNHSEHWFPIISGGEEGVKHAKKMATYNNQDVRLTIKDFRTLYPWYKSPISLLRLANLEFACPYCLQSDYHSEGTRPSKTGRYRRYQCNVDGCHGWFSERTAIKKKEGDISPAIA